MTQKRGKGDKKKTTTGIWFLLLGAIIISGMFAGGVAKYAHQESKDTEGSSAQFYFTSNYLMEEGKEYTLSANTTKLNIELRNFADNLRRSDTDISYSYSVRKDGKEIAKDVSGSITKNEEAGTTSDITLDNMSAGTYEVTVTTKSPYKKTLTGTFIIPKANEDISYTVNDSTGSPYILLTISAKTYNGNIKISWPGGVIPDSTQQAFEKSNTWNGNAYTAGTITTEVKSYSSYTYQFFKTDTSKVYSKSDITVEAIQ